MKRQNIPMLMIVVLAVLGGRSPAAGQIEFQFTFNVPVELHDLHPDIEYFNVRCTITSGSGVSFNGDSPWIELDANQSHSEPVIVQVNRGLPGEPADEAELLAFESCRCQLGLLPGPSQPLLGEVTVRPKEGTSYVNEVSGPIVHGG